MKFKDLLPILDKTCKCLIIDDLSPMETAVLYEGYILGIDEQSILTSKVNYISTGNNDKLYIYIEKENNQ